MKGKLISISGLDGAGKSTQIEALLKGLPAKGFKCEYFTFDATHYGAKAEETVNSLKANDIVFTRLCIDWTERYPLMKDFVYNQELQTQGLALAAAAVFAGGCIQVYESCLRPLLEVGVNVICDRFWLDDIVYRGLWIDEDFIRQLYASIPRPDLPIFLNTSIELIRARNSTRIDGKSPLMSSADTINMIRNRFVGLSQSDSMVIINGDRPKEMISEELLDLIATIL